MFAVMGISLLKIRATDNLFSTFWRHCNVNCKLHSKYFGNETRPIQPGNGLETRQGRYVVPKFHKRWSTNAKEQD